MDLYAFYRTVTTMLHAHGIMRASQILHDKVTNERTVYFKSHRSNLKIWNFSFLVSPTGAAHCVYFFILFFGIKKILNSCGLCIFVGCPMYVFSSCL
ncbi:uncharacterized protein BYT42DRAFT_557696 [Radiomyces spectabilis]|uniref:uncharacterized protein n=1 Tax=Radiomyces spectabilis TaxID=64574 RepID=UPI00221FC914|nr:uncharacterized protein BYT42DRAFT_557696 [Radiomyces spectabilis]KAI8391678.1 hypothetical protein BYT42DRAFT_557696 [Radiomyces spectabilis]